MIILGLVLYKETRTYEDVPFSGRKFVAPAPTFQLLDSGNRYFRLTTYLGRQQIVLAFYDAQAGVENSPLLQLLKQNYEQLDAAGIAVVAVSTALPQENRRAMQEAGGTLSFPLLSDVTLDVHKAWGRLQPAADVSAEPAPITGLFVIDRAGNVEWEDSAPRPSDAPARTIALLTGSD